MDKNQDQDDVYMCPSFNSYSSNRLAEIAVRVASNDQNDDEFEFSFVREDEEVSAEEFSRIKPIFPVFNRDLLNNDCELSTSCQNHKELSNVIPPSLGELFLEDRDYAPSCSSSEADELESVPEGTYCVWRPKTADSPMPSRCNKSKSTGSASKRWKLPDFLKRSNSEGKGNFVFLTPKNRDERSEKLVGKGKGVCSAVSGGAPPAAQSAHEALYIRNRAIKEGDKKKSYLPYRRDLVGFFGNVNGLGKSLPHF